MITLQGLLVFAAAARAEGFARAARELGLSSSAVAKDIARLERKLRVRLFHRTTRQVTLTQEGRELYQRAVRILDELEALEAAAEGAGDAPRGTLRLNVPVSYGRLVVVPVLAALRRKHPALAFDVRFSDARANLLGERLDAAVRIGTLEDSRQVARLIDEQRLLTVASPAYLGERGTPRRPAELVAHTCLRFRLPSSGRERVLQYRLKGEAVELDPAGPIVFDDGEALVAAAAAGVGIAQVPHYIAEPLLASGVLREILSRCRPPALPISVVYPSSKHVAPRLRVLIDALASGASAAVFIPNDSRPT
jgi:LysR family transcriptional regulator for bpeEF and oprC